MHPVVGLWPIALMQDLKEQLKTNVHKMQQWADRHGAVAVPFPCARFCGLSIDPFYNANTPQELGELRAMLRKTPS
jgi:molybdopterin-guanine dinucleotide biosynthesis protein A